MNHRLLTLAAILLIHDAALAQERSITVASTTSTEQSGLFGFLLPRFFSREVPSQGRIVGHDLHEATVMLPSTLAPRPPARPRASS